MSLLDGKATAQAVRDDIRHAVATYTGQGHRPPKLIAILVGKDPASQTYVGAKMKACAEVGFLSDTERYEASTTQAQLLARLAALNADDTVDGILVQLPLPKHIDGNAVIEAINPGKDADGFHPINLGRLAQGRPGVPPATPAGIVELLVRAGIDTQGKHVVVIGRSNIVGTPISLLLSRNRPAGNATVTLCHSRTEDLSTFTRQADILIAAAGRHHLIGKEDVKEGAIVVDVGMHRIDDPSKKRGFRLEGDVDLDQVGPWAAHHTPVPGGVGPMTIAMLLHNTLALYRQHLNLPA